MNLGFELLSKENFVEALAVQRAIFPGEDAEINFKEAIGTAPMPYYNHEVMWWIVRDNSAAVGIVGLYSYKEYRDDAFVAWFGILPEFRGRGYGRAALEFFEDEAKKRGYKNMRLYTDQDASKDAVRLYEKFGMTPESYHNKGEYEHTLVFSKSLFGGKVSAWNNKNLHLDEQRAKE